ncbi:V-type proton ATPase subunit S1 [Penaeus vannamei]|uniref:V-type proton ATPase subunit S1 n=1 Tax=Penaeus vannamei TaxID=6689 RepID=UPI000F66C9C8|nr:V-type proton ATPase subunit S1-like [Penaeus vannamei]XP_027228124.1 V-type proton ATPase subunit S1-like [Penaeus vannamei]
MKKAGLLVIFSALICGTFAKDTVPVLIWNSRQAQSGLPAVSALQYIDYGTFQGKYLQAFKPNNILLFEQDALSIEDLSSRPGKLHHVSQWMENSHSLYLPNVVDPTHLAHDLPSQGYNVVVLEPGSSTAGLQLKQQEKNLVIVKLPSTLTNPSRSHAIQKADEVMESVISKIGEMEDFTIIFTGRTPSVKMQDEFEQRVRIARSLQAAPEKGLRGFHNNDCVLLYLYKNITFNFYTNETLDNSYTISESEWLGNDTGECRPEAAKLLMKYNTAEYGKFQIQFNFLTLNSEWMLEGVKTLIDNKEDFFTLAKNDIGGIPLGMSYSCSEKTYLKNNSTTKSIMMVLDGFQVQPFNSSQTKFSGSWDCVGFFTVPIWCALLVTLLLLFILFSGMYMLSDIKTMDRFDDPKGKPIMVATAD